MDELIPNDYKTLLADVKEKILNAQYLALKAVNKELISLYCDIGKGRNRTQNRRISARIRRQNAVLSRDFERQNPPRGRKSINRHNLVQGQR